MIEHNRMNNMKILYILNSTVMGGANISFLNMVTGLQQKGVVPFVALPNCHTNQDFITILEQNRIAYFSVPIATSVFSHLKKHHFLHWLKVLFLMPIKKKKSESKLADIIMKVNPDIIHTNVGIVHEGFHLARRYGIPHVWHLREYQTKGFNWHIYPCYKTFCSYLNKSFVITITDDIKSFFKLDKNGKAHTIYNGIFHKSDVCYIKEKENYFLLSSRISPEKMHLDVVKAFSSFSKKDSYRLLIAGTGSEEYKAEILKTAKSLRCEDRIDFIGFHHDVRPLMSKAKALIVASWYEGFGRMTAEAAFCGTLTIGRNTAGTKEILDVIGGFPFTTVDEMTLQMEKVAEMFPNDYEAKALTAQKEAVAHYSIENNVNQVYSLYCDVLRDAKKLSKDY